MSSIFDLSGQTPKKKPAKPATPSPARDEPSEDPVETLKKIRNLHVQLSDEILSLEKKIGIDPKEVNETLKGIERLNPNTLKKLEEQKKELKMKIFQVGERQLKEKQAGEDAKARKGKTLGARKRWLDMR